MHRCTWIVAAYRWLTVQVGCFGLRVSGHLVLSLQLGWSFAMAVPQWKYRKHWHGCCYSHVRCDAVNVFQAISLMRASGAVTQSFSVMFLDFRECFTHLQPLSCMLLLATMTLAFITCMMYSDMYSLNASNIDDIKGMKFLLKSFHICHKNWLEIIKVFTFLSLKISLFDGQDWNLAQP